MTTPVLDPDDYEIKPNDSGPVFVGKFNGYIRVLVNQVIPYIANALILVTEAKDIAARVKAVVGFDGSYDDLADKPDLDKYLPHTGGVLTDVAETASTATTSDVTVIDLAEGNFPTITVDQHTHLSITGATAGEASVLVLRLIDADKFMVNLADCNFDWGDEEAPTLTSKCEITAYCYDGSTWNARFRSLV